MDGCAPSGGIVDGCESPNVVIYGCATASSGVVVPGSALLTIDQSLCIISCGCG